ncbi:MAG: hypothetical protein NTW50_02045 [Candidatus Berkelbacteria bacterium]|nr:hypothetical protein [Candidatus Berkelbacteria bacterium]
MNIYAKIAVVAALGAMCIFLMGASGCEPTSDETQREAQEKILAEGTAQTGMPSIKNFRERKLLKDILELRDQDGLATYTYIENLSPSPVKGKTALGGKLTFMGESIGYGIPYATQFTNPQKAEYHSGYVVLPQADPNGLFSPSSAEGTWVLLKDPHGKDVKPVYIEPRIVVAPFKLPAD